MIIVITGPTGVGKTKLSIEIAKSLNGEIINADSTQIFKDLNIATAKVTKEEMEGIPHHLIDIKEITEDYTVFDYQKDARKKIKEILKKGKTPILVGGTGLYIKATLYNYQFEVEKKETKDYSNYTNEELYNMLPLEDQKQIHPNNRKRVIRALEYFSQNHHSISSKEKNNTLLYPTIFIGLELDRQTLYHRINNRVDEMIKNGLLEEAKKIYDTNIRSKAVMTPIGYKELFNYFDQKISFDSAIEEIKKRSRNYAKRQYTWFSHQMNIKWFSVKINHFDETIKEVREYLNQIDKSFNL